MPFCKFCSPRPKWFPTTKAITHHRANNPSCKAGWNAHIAHQIQKMRRYDPYDPEDVPREDEPEGGYDPLPDGFEAAVPDFDSILPNSNAEDDTLHHDHVDSSTLPESDQPQPRLTPTSKQHRIVTPHPNRAQTYGPGRTSFEKRKEEEADRGETPYRNFKDAETFEVAEWLLTSGLSQKETSRLLRTRMMKRAKARWKNARALLQQVDKLPRGPAWHHHTLDVKHPTKENCVENIEFYYRNPLDVIQDLIGNPDFNNPEIISFEPVEVRVGPDGCTDEEMVREYGEMNTGEWWNTLQGKLPAGATLVPVILSSDKTQLSLFGGDKSAWPVYLTIGNIAKGTRRQPSKHAVLLLGYLSATKLTFIKDKKARSAALKRLFHDSMQHILEPLRKAGKDGVMMTCADGYIRKVFPVLAAYIADNPEQHLIACTKQSFCPVCEVPPCKRGTKTSYPYRKHNRTIKAILTRTRPKNLHTLDDAANFDSLGLHPIEPFWISMPYVDADTLFTPDILHQLHKGMFQTHILSWITTLLTKNEIDQRFQALPRFSGLRHFSKGVSHISQMTGKEQKELEKVLMVIIAGGHRIPKQAVVAASGLLNFIYLARFPQHTTETLEMMEEALERFHQYKGVFLGKKLCKSFNNIPKLHSMQHYIDSIRQKGSADGFSTEAPERLHIEFAKKGYRASNKLEYLKQMVRWLERQEGMNCMRSYLAWCDGYKSFIDDDSGGKGSGESSGDGDGTWFLDDEDDEESSESPEVNPILNTQRDGDGNDGNGRNPGSITSPLAPLAPLPASCRLPTLFAVGNPLDGRPPDVKHHLTKEPTFVSQTFQSIEERHGVTDFGWYFYDYMKDACGAVYDAFDEDNSVFEVWKSFKMALPQIRDISTSSRTHTIVASPAYIRRDHLRSRHIPARFDTVFVYYQSDTPLVDDIQKGYRVAQVRAIFRLSSRSSLFKHHSEPLALVQFFNRLPPAPNKDTGIFSVTRAFRQNQRHAAIVPLSSIHFPCHLTPVFSAPTVPPAWLETGTAHINPLESERAQFLVNPFVSLTTYAFFCRIGWNPLAADRLPFPITTEEVEEEAEDGVDQDSDADLDSLDSDDSDEASEEDEFEDERRAGGSSYRGVATEAVIAPSRLPRVQVGGEDSTTTRSARDEETASAPSGLRRGKRKRTAPTNPQGTVATTLRPKKRARGRG